MTQQSQTPMVSRRRKLLIQLLAFIALAVLLYVSPKIEAWVHQRQESAQAQAQSSEPTKISTEENPESEPSSADVTSEENAPSEEPTVASGEPQESAGSSDAAVKDEPAATTSSKDEPKAKTTSADEKPKAEDKSDKSKTTEKKKKSSGKSSVVPMNRDPAPKRTAGESAKDATDKKSPENPEWGKLREIRENVFESTAGLVYRSGSADGHRLKHVMQHAKDDLSKPVHGVFIGEGDRDIVLALIDEAFDKAKKGGKDVRKEEQNGRTVFTVNMKKTVGFTGGQEGERRGNPECRFIRIVVEREKEVISAFPTNR